MNSDHDHLICFDLGGVLVRLTHSWNEACDIAGVPTVDFHDDPFAMEHVREAVYAFERGHIGESVFFGQMVAALPDYNTDQIAGIVDAWLIEMYDGVDALLDELDASPHTTACLSNTNRRHWATLMNGHAHYAPLKRLTHPHASHLIAARKPDADAYVAVEENTGWDPARIVFFDDRPENIAAAQTRGWAAHQVDPHGDPVAEMRRRLAEMALLD